MNDQNNEFTSEEDAVVRDKLSQIYSAPSDPAYWSSLQVRILARVADSDPGLWWVFLGRWSRAGVVAATLALVAAGAASVITAQQPDDALAYQALLDDGVPVASGPASLPLTTLEKVSSMVGVSEDEAAVRYVMSLVDGPGR